MAVEENRGRSLPRLAQWADLVASAAVVVTLVFLAVEVRQDTQVVQAASYDRSIESLNQWRLTLATNPDLAEVWQAHIGPEGTGEDPVLDFRLAIMVHMQWAIYENAYYAERRGLLGSSEWGRFQVQICRRFKNDGSRWSEAGTGNQAERELLTEEFRQYVEGNCQDSG